MTHGRHAGIAQSYATVSTATNLAARLCAEAAGGQILISRRVPATIEELVEAEPIGELGLPGFLKPVTSFARRAGAGGRTGDR